MILQILKMNSPRICFAFSLIFCLGISCSSNQSAKKLLNPAEQKAQEIVDRAIAAHGGKKYQKASIEFDFRKRHYKSVRDKGQYQYERTFTDKEGAAIRDVLTNEEFYREVNGQRKTLTDKERNSWSGSVNSVHYFVQLPALLNDPAVIKTYAGESSIKGKQYHKVEVRFRKEGGGRDHEDVYMYWFDQSTHTMDYLAYNFLVNGGGARFREAYNIRVVNGIRFADYINYKPKADQRDVAQFDQLFENIAI